MADIPSLNTAQRGVKIFGQKIWGLVLAILGGLYTLLGAGVLLLFIGFNLVRPQDYYALPPIYMSIDWTVAIIISVLYLAIGVLSLILGIRQVGWGKKHHWG